MGRDSETNVRAHYNTSPQRVLDEARGADSIIVLAMKGGKPQLWASDTQDRAQDFITQYFPEAVLPEPAMAGAD